MTQQQTDEINRLIHERTLTEGISVHELHGGLYLGMDLGLDSLDVVELTMEIEKTFDIFIDVNDPDTSWTIKQLYELIDKLLGNG